MQIKCFGCGASFQSKLTPCPDGREGCAVAHYDQKSFICPECGHDNLLEVRDAIKEGRVVEEMGVGVVNLAALKKVKLYGGDDE